MPIIKPEVQKILRTAGLIEDRSEISEDSLNMDQQLSISGLNGESIAEELTNLALHSQNESLRLRALETALRVKGALKDQPAQLPTFNIVIQGSSTDLSKTEGVNPIIFPRQSLSEEKKKEKKEKPN